MSKVNVASSAFPERCRFPRLISDGQNVVLKNVEWPDTKSCCCRLKDRDGVCPTFFQFICLLCRCASIGQLVDMGHRGSFCEWSISRRLVLPTEFKYSDFRSSRLLFELISFFNWSCSLRKLISAPDEPRSFFYFGVERPFRSVTFVDK